MIGTKLEGHPFEYLTDPANVLDLCNYLVMAVGQFYYQEMAFETMTIDISDTLHYEAYVDYFAVGRLNHATSEMGEFQSLIDKIEHVVYVGVGRERI